MRKFAVSENELMHLFEMCLDAEERCEQRRHAFSEKGDHEEAAYQAQLRDKYSRLKGRLFTAMKNPEPSSLDQILQMLRGVGDGLPARESIGT